VFRPKGGGASPSAPPPKYATVCRQCLQTVKQLNAGSGRTGERLDEKTERRREFRPSTLDAAVDKVRCVTGTEDDFHTVHVSITRPQRPQAYSANWQLIRTAPPSNDRYVFQTKQRSTAKHAERWQLACQFPYQRRGLPDRGVV